MKGCLKRTSLKNDKYGKVITAEDLAKGEKTEDLPEQKPADSEEQAL